MENVVEANGASSWEGPSAGLVVSVTEFYVVLNCSLGRAAACGLLQKWLRLGGGWRGLRGWDPHGGPVQSPVEHPGPTRRSQPMRCSTRDAPHAMLHAPCPAPCSLLPPPGGATALSRTAALPHTAARRLQRAAAPPAARCEGGSCGEPELKGPRREAAGCAPSCEELKAANCEIRGWKGRVWPAGRGR